jgi:hypothetical protein
VGVVAAARNPPATRALMLMLRLSFNATALSLP